MSDDEPNKEETRTIIEKSEKELEEEERNSHDDMDGAKCPQIECFDGKNFSSWMAQIEAILFLNDLWIDLESSPETLATAPIMLKANKAYMHIITCCDREHVNFLSSEAKGNSVKALNLLKSKYDRDVIKVAELRTALLMRFTRGPLDEHINSMLSKYQKLKCHGLDLPPLVQIVNLIISMPREYDGVVGSVLRMQDDKLNFLELAEALLDEEKRRSIMKPSEELAQASTITERRPEKVIKCGNCGRRGHYAKICHQPPNNVKPGSSESATNNFANNRKNSSARAKCSQYNENFEEEDSEVNKIYSNVAFSSKFEEPKFVEERSRPNHSKLNEDSSFREKRLNKRIVSQKQENVAEEELSQSSPKRTKKIENVNHDPLFISFSPDRKRKENKLPITPGKRLDDELNYVSPAGSEFSISNVAPALSSDGGENWNKIDEMYETCFNCNFDATKI